MINRAKLQHILEYAKQQRHIGLHCKVPPEDMVEIVEMAMLQGAEPVTTAYKLRDAVETIRNSGIEIDADKILAERDALNSPVIAEGWVMVPAEPTAEMLQSGISAHYERSQVQIHDRPAPGPMECAYVAMIAAAPQQEVK